MDTLLNVLPWETIGPSGVLLFVVVYIMRTVSRGDWVPRSTHDSIVSMQKETLAMERLANAELRAALRIVAIEHGTTTDKVLSALPLLAEQKEESDA